jgi:predicted molibdopterin-dependent oxidoreductase YjgC
MFDATVTTTCGCCGVGCRLEAHARDGEIAAVSHAVDVRPIGEEATMKPAPASA